MMKQIMFIRSFSLFIEVQIKGVQYFHPQTRILHVHAYDLVGSISQV